MLEKIAKKLNILGKIIYALAVVSLVVIALGVTMSALDVPGGVKLFTVQSGSMEPVVKTGSVVIVKPQNEYYQGDIITFKDVEKPKVTITHRINSVVEGDSGERLFETKGDANEGADLDKTSKENVLGKVVFNVPYLGYPVAFAKTQTGFIVLIIIPATLLVYGELMNIKKEVSEIIRRKKETESEVKVKKNVKKKN